MSGVIDFYKETLSSLGLITDEEGFIKVGLLLRRYNVSMKHTGLPMPLQMMDV